jgi:hypothetical protein
MDYIKKYNILTPDECKKLIEIILSVENDIKKIGPDLYSGTSDDSLTGRFHCFNFLNIESVNSILAPKIKAIFGPCTIQCWTNVFRNNEGIETHSHKIGTKPYPEFYASANIFLCGDPTIGTYYNDIKHESIPGQLTVFPVNMPHGVPKNSTNDVRISMAMDIYIGNESYMKLMIAKDPRRYIFLN